MHGGQFRVLAADDQVVTLGDQRDEVQAEGSGGGSGGDAAVGFALADGLRGGQVSMGDAVVAGDLIVRDAGGAEMLVEDFAAACSFFAIDDADVFPRQVLNGADRTAGRA